MDQEIFLLAAHLTLLILATICDNIIRSYLCAKPTGMQTFLDQMIYHFTIIHNLVVAFATVMLGVFELLEPLDDFIAKAWTFTVQVIALMGLVSAFAVLAVR